MREPTAQFDREPLSAFEQPRPATPGSEPAPQLQVAPMTRSRRRTFDAPYKTAILQEADRASALGAGAVGALLRREGLYASHLAAWRRQRAEGGLAGLIPKKRGRKPKNPLAAEKARLEYENACLKVQLAASMELASGSGDGESQSRA